MAKEPMPRPHVAPEQSSVNARRQRRRHPGLDSGPEEDFESIDPSDEPGFSPDLAEGPVFDAAEAPPSTFNRSDDDPEAPREDGDEVEIHHKPKG
jgi:hypothetical protein